MTPVRSLAVPGFHISPFQNKNEFVYGRKYAISKICIFIKISKFFLKTIKIFILYTFLFVTSAIIIFRFFYLFVFLSYVVERQIEKSD